MPTQAELEEAAFVRRELAVAVPQLDLDLHRARVEQRVRPLRPDEPVDLSRLAIDPTQLPPVLTRDPPAAKEVTSLVDAFFSQLQWTDKAVTGVHGAEEQALKPQLDERALSEEATSRLGDRPRSNRDEEERDV
jgi:type IV secretion system protein VirD4